GDIQVAPEDIKRLYKEYKMLKQQREESDPTQLSPSCPPAAQETPTQEQVPESGCWGSHLNRPPKPPKSGGADPAVPKASSHVYGMKLKSKLGAAGKPPPPPPRGKFQRLKEKVTQRLGSLDPAWLQRCQEIPGDKGTKQEVGWDLLELEEGAAVGDSRRKRPGGDGAGAQESFGAASEEREEHVAAQKESGKRSDPMGNVLEELEEGGGAAVGDSRGKTPHGDDGAAAPVKLQRCHQALAKESFGTASQEKEEHVAAQKESGKPSNPMGNLLEEEQEVGAAAGSTRRKRPRGDDSAGSSRKLRRCHQASAKGSFGTASQEEHMAAQKESGKTWDPMENIPGELEEEHEKPRPTRRAAPRSDGNFVRLCLKRKSHVRGHALRGNRLRKQVWKQKWKKKAEWLGGGSRSRSSDLCFRCGGTGHWASTCGAQGTAPGALPEESNPAEEEEEDPLPTLEEVARRTNTVFPTFSGEAPPGSPGSPLTRLDVRRLEHEPPAPPVPVEPFYIPDPEGKVPEPPDQVLEALKTLGYSSFRPGQELAVMRILSGLSTLVVLSTGMGKSLCYQLPAYLYHKRSKCITLVISPLVSLMDDQVSGLPTCLKAVCIHSNMSRLQREAAMEKVRQGEVQVLLLSPEALVGAGSGSGCGFLPSSHLLPPVAFACIDEAHCLSEWSHNFRPSYLRLCKVLRDRLGVRCFLGLTATATVATARDVSRIPQGITVHSASVPPNLHLSVSMDRDRDQALISLLQGERFGCLDSIIIYCTRREETTRIAALIRTCLQGMLLGTPPQEPTGSQEPSGNAAPKRKAKAKRTPRRPLRWVSDAYHAGLSASERRRVQNNFMSGQLRVVVATVAFGMGLDKPDVRGIIHYNMPKNFETYVQEIGRAGRDGEPAHCHLFLDPEGGDLHELRRHIYGDTVDFVTLKKLVRMVFDPCKCLELHRKHRNVVKDMEVEDSEMAKLLEEKKEEEEEEKEEEEEGSGAAPRRVCYKHERSIPIQPTVEALDVREEGIETLLCYLELHPGRWLELLHPTYSSCRIRCYGGSRQLQAAARSSPPVAVFLARERLAGRDHSQSSSLEFDVISLSDSMGWEAPLVKRSLRQLQWDQQLRRGGGTGTSGILVEFGDLSFHFRSYGDLTDQELDSLCDFLHGKVVAREKTALGQLRACFRAFQSVAFQTCGLHSEEEEEERSSRLKALLHDYFQKEEEEEEEEAEEEDLGDLTVSKSQLFQIRADIRRFLAIRPEEKFSGRAIARIFHGIGSPCFPAQVFGRDRRFWRNPLPFNFHRLSRLASEEILASR
ncbi:PREDICTED: ATP-dependent DNA helicase Q4, partial [Chaetura pelagica]|uniref:ATP-dependent DNA helicase Q4 n=1 Tax=Chaetura pelagica TaxID=8897 RepID=UPI0005238F1F